MQNKRILTVSYSYNRTDKKVPFIRLQGKWLEDKGFDIGDKIEIQYSQHSLIIRHAEKSQFGQTFFLEPSEQNEERQLSKLSKNKGQWNK